MWPNPTNAFSAMACRRRGIVTTLVLLLVCSRSESGGATAVRAPSTMFWNSTALIATRAVVWAGTSPSLNAAAASLASDAASQATAGPWSVMDKQQAPPGGTLHDYWSVGAYWFNCTALCDPSLFQNCSAWTHSDLGPPGPPYANCSAATGLPWYDHDGFDNPINRKLDPPRLGAMTDGVVTLALSAFYLNNTAHGSRAATLLRAWFLSRDTRMNPSGAFAQGIPGRCEGRGTGLIDFATPFPDILDSVALLRFTGAWESTDDAALRDWFAEWLDYLLSSQNGRDEAASLNNHGTNYDRHVVAIALALGNHSVAAAVCTAAGVKRIGVQVGPNGTLPLEDSRTKSEEYHLFDTEGLLMLATLCTTVAPSEESLFTYRCPDTNRGLELVMQWLLPFAQTPPSQPWPFEQIRSVSLDASWASIFRMAANAPAWASTATDYANIAQSHVDHANGTAWQLELTLPLTSI
eukprot:m.91178 g.91178  ORF g.91178 m.91178 type:complete len:465 (+) comp20171_c0_seq1:78-1472(+)